MEIDPLIRFLFFPLHSLLIVGVIRFVLDWQNDYICSIDRRQCRSFPFVVHTGTKLWQISRTLKSLLKDWLEIAAACYHLLKIHRWRQQKNSEPREMWVLLLLLLERLQEAARTQIFTVCSVLEGYFSHNPRGDWWLTTTTILCLLRSRCESGCKWYCYRHAVPTGGKWHHAVPKRTPPLALVHGLCLLSLFASYRPPLTPSVNLKDSHKICCPLAWVSRFY